MDNFFQRFRRNRGDRENDTGTTNPPENDGNASDFASQYPEFAAFLDSINPERLFERDMAAAMAASLQDNQQQQQSQSVPASAASIRQLPTVRVCRKDFMVNPCNRECTICLEANPVNSSCIRMPCAHLFHRDCLLSWLTKSSNSCPVCRYEIPTDNAEYEVGRRERMKNRKPRFAQHELDQLSVSQLKALLPVSDKKHHFTERQEIVRYLVDIRAIDLAAIPQPVSYKWSVLSKMSVAQLRTVMNEKGCFFDQDEVVEKNDVLQIFLHSGCLIVLPEDPVAQTKCEGGDKEFDEEGSKLAAISNSTDVPISPERRAVSSVGLDDSKFGTVLVETVSEDAKDCTDRRTNQDLVMEEDDNFSVPVAGTFGEPTADRPRNPSESSEETIEENMDCDSKENGASTIGRVPVQQNESVSDAAAESIQEETPRSTGTVQETSSEQDYSILNETVGFSNDAVDGNGAESSSSQDSCSSRKRQHVELGEMSATSSTAAVSNAGNPTAVSIDDDRSSHSGEAVAQFTAQSIAQLRILALQHSIDLSGCIERRDIVERLVSSLSDFSVEETENAGEQYQNSTASRQSTTPDGDPLDSWGISEIRALAELSELDLSDCRSREEMVQALQKTAIQRPQVANYFHTLAPLACLSVSQLRAVARERQICVSDCLEKGDIIKRLVRETPSSPSVW